MYRAGVATPATTAARWGADLIVAAVSASLEELMQLEGFVNEQAMALEPSRVGASAQVRHKALMGCAEKQADGPCCLAYAPLQSRTALALPAQFGYHKSLHPAFWRSSLSLGTFSFAVMVAERASR